MSRRVVRKNGQWYRGSIAFTPTEPPPPVTQTFTDDFETGDFRHWDVLDQAGDAYVRVLSSDATMYGSSDPAWSGDFGGRITVTANTGSRGNIQKVLPSSAADKIAASGMFNWRIAGTASNSNLPSFRIFNGTQRLIDVFRANDTGGLWLRRTDASDTMQFHNLGVVAPLGVWTKVDISLERISTSDVTVEVKVDNVQRLLLSLNVKVGAFNKLYIGAEHNAQEGEFDFDAITITPAAPLNIGTTYFVDSSAAVNGDGLSDLTPINSLSVVNALELFPGDRVLFKKGSFFQTARLNITRSGTAHRRITFGSYGDTGDMPTFDGGGNYDPGFHQPESTDPSLWPSAGSIQPIDVRGVWVTIEGLRAQKSSYTGIDLFSANVIVQDCLSRWNISGIETADAAHRAVIRRNTVLDNKVMSYNDTTHPDNDSGAFGIQVHGAYGNIGHNYVSGCAAYSYDYGLDGGALEVYRGHHNRFHHNFVQDSEAGCEIGDKASINNLFDHNVVYEPTRPGVVGFNFQGSGWGGLYGSRLEHNTVYLPATDGTGFLYNRINKWTAATSYSVGDRIIPPAPGNNRVYEVTVAGVSGDSSPSWPLAIGSTLQSGATTFRTVGIVGKVYNNVIVSEWKPGYCGQSIDEDYNWYSGYRNGQNQILSINSATPETYGSIGPNSIDQRTAPAPFVNVATGDLHLVAGAPPLNAGANLSYRFDYDMLPRLVGTAPDMGAYERQS